MKQILIAGIGNIFQGDDGFGCKVIHELIQRNFPDEVTVVDFGIRIYDLAYALTDGYHATILVAAMARGGKPGAVFLIEPDMSRLNEPSAAVAREDSTNPVSVLQLAQSFGPVSGQIFVVGCEPAVLDNEPGDAQLSPEVRRAVPAAVEMIESLAGDVLGRPVSGTSAHPLIA